MAAKKTPRKAPAKKKSAGKINQAEAQVQADELPDRAITVDTDDHETPDELTKLQHIHNRWQVHQSFWSKLHSQAIEDDKMVAGIHWDPEKKKEREDDGRPVLTYNLIPSFHRQIVNRIRQDSPQIKVIPQEVDKRSKSTTVKNTTGKKDYTMSQVFSGLIKNIEHQSRADQAYDTAVKHAVDHGFGFFYLKNEYSRTDPFVQNLAIKRVRNSFCVTLDPDAQEADFRDGQDAFMWSTLDENTFKRKYPDARATNYMGMASGTDLETWFRNGVTIAHYYWIEYVDDEVLKLSNGKTVYLSQVEDVLDELEEKWGVHVVEYEGKDGEMMEMRKAVKRPVCMWQKMTYSDVLAGPLELPFSAIPIFIVTGEEMIVNGELRLESASRHAHDAQRSYNYWRTAAAETVALAPKAPWTITSEQIEGHEELWEEANKRNLPYLEYNHIENQPPPQRNFPTGVAAAELSNAQQDAVDMQTIIGLHDASLGRESNEKSGKAIIARQNQGNTSTYQFPDNLTRAMEQMGRLAVEAIPRLYDSERVERIRLPDGTEDFVTFNEEVKDDDSGDTFLVHDINIGKYDVVMETGPNYQTQRQEAADMQMELLKILGPDRAANIVHLIVKNLGVPGGDEVYEVLRKMLPDQLKTQEEKEADLPPGITFDEKGQMVDEDGKPWQPPPTPEQQIAMKEQELRDKELQAREAEAQAKMAKSEADKKEAEAQIQKAQAEVQKAQIALEKAKTEAGAQGGQGIDMKAIEKIIRTVMKEHEANPEAHKNVTADQAAEAVADAMKRIKRYVDKQMARLEKAEAREEAGEAA